MHRNKIKLGKFSMVSKPFILILKCVCMTMSTEPGWAVTDCRMTCYRLLDDLLQTAGCAVTDCRMTCYRLLDDLLQTAG